MGLKEAKQSGRSTERRAVQLLKKQLEASLDRYLKDEAALAEAADFAEAKMLLVAESLQFADQDEDLTHDGSAFQ